MFHWLITFLRTLVLVLGFLAFSIATATAVDWMIRWLVPELF